MAGAVTGLYIGDPAFFPSSPLPLLCTVMEDEDLINFTSGPLQGGPHQEGPKSRPGCGVTSSGAPSAVVSNLCRIAARQLTYPSTL
jgi:hypothetical protein